MLRYNLPNHFWWSNFYIAVTNDSQSLSRHRSYLNNLSLSGCPCAKQFGLKIIAGVWWGIISWEGSLWELVMSFIKAELYFDIWEAVANMTAVSQQSRIAGKSWLWGNGKNLDDRRGAAVVYLILGHRAERAGSGWIWTTGRQESWNKTDMRSTEKEELKESSAEIWVGSLSRSRYRE